MSENKMTARQKRDIGCVRLLLNQGISEAKVYQKFETWYNRRGQNPWWEDKAPDKVFAFILDVINNAKQRKEAMK